MPQVWGTQWRLNSLLCSNGQPLIIITRRGAPQLELIKYKWIFLSWLSNGRSRLENDESIWLCHNSRVHETRATYLCLFWNMISNNYNVNDFSMLGSLTQVYLYTKHIHIHTYTLSLYMYMYTDIYTQTQRRTYIHSQGYPHILPHTNAQLHTHAPKTTDTCRDICKKHIHTGANIYVYNIYT